jgi:hypothetical protein
MTVAMVQAQRRAIITLAQLRARNAVKEELKRQRVRLADVEAKEITSWAQVYLDDHAEQLIAEAKSIVDLWASQGRFGPRGGFRPRR